MAQASLKTGSRPPYSTLQALQWLLQLASALDYLHTQQPLIVSTHITTCMTFAIETKSAWLHLGHVLFPLQRIWKPCADSKIRSGFVLSCRFIET